MLTLVLALALSPSDLSCRKDADCAAVGVGARACGGPQAYLVYSKRSKRRDKIVAEAQASVKEAKEKLEKEGGFGACVVAPEPVVACVKGVCAKKA